MVAGRRYRQSCPLWPIKKKKKTQLKHATIVTKPPRKGARERVGKSETKEKSKGEEVEKLLGGKRRRGKKVNDNRKTDFFWCFYNFGLPRVSNSKNKISKR